MVLNAGANLTCTLTNTKLATIRIDKVTSPTANPTPFAFTATGGLTPSSFGLADQDPPVVFANVMPNQPYQIKEATPSNWQLGTSGAGCGSIAGGVTVTPPPGADITCTFTNTESGTITIDKTALGGDGAFQIKQPTLGNQTIATIGGVGSITYANVLPGSYTFGETPVAGWTQGPFGGDCGPSGTVSVTPGAAAALLAHEHQARRHPPSTSPPTRPIRRRSSAWERSDRSATRSCSATAGTTATRA